MTLVSTLEDSVASKIFNDLVPVPTASVIVRSWTIPLLGTGIYRIHWYLYAQPGGAGVMKVNGNQVFLPGTENVEHGYTFQLALNAGDDLTVETTSTINTAYAFASDLVITQIG